MEQQHTQSVEPLTVNVPTAAGMLGISRTLAFQLEREGKLPGAFRLGGRILVSRAALSRYVNDEPAGSP